MRVQDRLSPDYYRELQVDPFASKATIKAAYYTLARQYHPDVNTRMDAADKMQRINEAYEVLSSEPKRRLYDLQRARSYEPLVTSGTRPVGAAEEKFARSWTAGIARGTRKLHQTHPHSVARLAAYAVLAAVGVLAMVLTLFALGVLPPRGSDAAQRQVPKSANVHQVFAPAVDGPTVAPTQATTGSRTVPSHAAEFVAGIASRSSPLDQVSDEKNRLTSAEHAFLILTQGCTVFAGEYSTQSSLDNARRYWSTENQQLFEAKGNMIVAVFGCSSQQNSGTVDGIVKDVLQALFPNQP